MKRAAVVASAAPLHVYNMYVYRCIIWRWVGSFAFSTRPRERNQPDGPNTCQMCKTPTYTVYIQDCKYSSSTGPLIRKYYLLQYCSPQQSQLAKLKKIRNKLSSWTAPIRIQNLSESFDPFLWWLTWAQGTIIRCALCTKKGKQTSSRGQKHKKAQHNNNKMCFSAPITGKSA